jgi:ABC-2 type transport system ATP-binding protein
VPSPQWWLNHPCVTAVIPSADDCARPATGPAHVALPVIEAIGVSQRYGRKLALDRVSLAVPAGAIHALLGPNGAGKTTLIRILAGLNVPAEGAVTVGGIAAGPSSRYRKLVGLVPSGDRTFYLRISGLENLVFFGRLQGLSRRTATRRAEHVLEEVGLREAAKQRVGSYSHGMQKRLSVARALIPEPRMLLVDEATHDLDPDGARRVRDLVAAAATSRGAAVVWATQRLDEIRGFADRVTLLARGREAFLGTVPDLLAHAVPRRYLIRVADSWALEAVGRNALGRLGSLEAAGESSAGQYLLDLEESAVLGDALARLSQAGIKVLTCREERSEIEEAFLSIAGGTTP